MVYAMLAPHIQPSAGQLQPEQPVYAMLAPHIQPSAGQLQPEQPQAGQPQAGRSQAEKPQARQLLVASAVLPRQPRQLPQERQVCFT